MTIIIVLSQSQLISYPDLPRPKRSEIWVQDQSKDELENKIWKKGESAFSQN